MRYFILIACLVFLASCSKNKEYYSFHLGPNSFQMEMHDNIDISKKEFIDKAMEVWKTMEEGESEWFYYSRTRPISGMDGKATEDGRRLTANTTSSSGKLRFFKNREGLSGIEAIGENGPFAMISGKHLSESDIRLLLTQDLEHMGHVLED